MMLRSIALKALWDQRRSIVWWGVGITAIVLLLVLLYPSVRDAPEFQQVVESLPEAMRNLFLGSSVVDFLSPTGYLNSRFFAFLGPALFLVYGIGQGVGAVAGEEERGTLEVVLSAPVSRWRLVVERFAALAVGVAVLAGVAFAMLWAGGALVSMGIAPDKLLQACVSLGLLTLFYGTLALAIGAASGRRGAAIGISTGVAVAGYLVDALAPLASVLDALRPASPFKYYGEAAPLANGLDPLHAGVLLVGIAVLLAMAAVGFERRDMRT